MKQEIVRIHGGEAKENHKNFDDFLSKLKYDPIREKRIKWGMTLEKDLGEDKYEIFQPQMPNKMYATYKHWNIMFEKVIPFLSDDVILIGHSMGATFLAKYLNENHFPLKIKKIILISGAFDDIEGDVIGTFSFDKNLVNLKKYGNKIILIHSKDDNIVPFSHFNNFKEVLTNSEYMTFEDRGHFIDRTFLELIDYIKNLK